MYTSILHKIITFEFKLKLVMYELTFNFIKLYFGLK